EQSSAAGVQVAYPRALCRLPTCPWLPLFADRTLAHASRTVRHSTPARDAADYWVRCLGKRDLVQIRLGQGNTLRLKPTHRLRHNYLSRKYLRCKQSLTLRRKVLPALEPGRKRRPEGVGPWVACALAESPNVQTSRLASVGYSIGDGRAWDKECPTERV